MAETIASYEVPEHHVKMYTANVRAALHKEGGLIYPLMSQGSYKGEKVQLINFIGEVEFIERNTPYSDTKLTQLEHTQTWIVGKEYDCAVLVDRLDTLQMIYDPTNPYVDRFREAAARKMDEIAVSKFFATMKTGKDGGTDTAFLAGDAVAHGGTALTVLKLRALRKLIKKRQVDIRTVQPYLAVTADEIDDLLDEVVVGSKDFNQVQPLVNGEVSSYMGFKFIPYEDRGAYSLAGGSSLAYDAGAAIRYLPCWIEAGMHFGKWEDLVITINNRPDKNNIKQIHGTFTAGATRQEQGKVFQVGVKR